MFNRMRDFRGNAPNTVYRLIDHRNPVDLNEKEVSVLIDHANALDAEIRILLRGSGTTLNLGLIVLALAVSVTKDVSRDIALPTLIPLLGIAASWNFLNAAEIAALAEVRDRIASRVNIYYKTPVLLWRIASDVRRGSPGTLAMNGMLALTYFGISITAVGYAFVRAVQEGANSPIDFWYPYIVIVLFLATTSTVVICYREVVKDRNIVKRNLRLVFGMYGDPEYQSKAI